MATDPLEKVRKLVALAAHPETPPTEATAAAMQACKRIHADNLLLAPKGDPYGETIEVRGPFVCVTVTHESYIVKRALPWTMPDYPRETLVFPKWAIVDMKWMLKDERKKRKFHGTVVTLIVVQASWFKAR